MPRAFELNVKARVQHFWGLVQDKKEIRKNFIEMTSSMAPLRTTETLSRKRQRAGTPEAEILRAIVEELRQLKEERQQHNRRHGRNSIY